MAATRDWQRNRDMWVRVLEKQTGEGVDVWNRRIERQWIADEKNLREWLTSQGSLAMRERCSSWSDLAIRSS
jgi:hypothetical protein